VVSAFYGGGEGAVGGMSYSRGKNQGKENHSKLFLEGICTKGEGLGGKIGKRGGARRGRSPCENLPTDGAPIQEAK